ncbi:hypothetical protein PMAYCL1PPCAC_32552 [Pristionchus mayeri]|uniref:F-box domain-containing protein n=1 Tax=Pristionchus mayeri TaxID=1317129 RepID=A0AAN5DH04_9BILA|nr:hypothetical protein PMAYCL1PPCAC_32552 [Pristionchus mayeri]
MDMPGIGSSSPALSLSTSGSTSSSRKRPFPGDEEPSSSREAIDYAGLEHYEGPYLDYYSYACSQQHNSLNPIKRMPALTSFEKGLAPHEEDVISKQPDDVLYKVFSYLDRKTIDAMKVVSQRMNFFANQPSLNKIKYNSSEIKIVQNHEGHAFFLRSSNPDIDSCVLNVRCLDLVRNQPPSVHFSDSEYGKALRFYDRRFKFIGYHHKSLDDFIGYNAVSPRNHETPIPRILFTKLGWLLEKYAVMSLKFVNIVIDVNFLKNVCETFKGVDYPSMHFEGAVFQDGFSDARCAELARWILSVKPRSIYVDETALEHGRVFDEVFIIKMASAVKYKNMILRVKSREQDANSVRFHATAALIPRLAHFITLHLHSLTIDVRWLVEAFKIRMKPSYATGDWRFCLNSNFDPRVYCTQRMLGPHHEYAYDSAMDCHLIRCRNSDNFVGFYISTTYQPSVFVVEAKFENNRQQKFKDRPLFLFAFERRHRR